jgi:hypothetical protein
MDLPPASWMKDPSARHHLRYWNGRAWTEHVADNGRTSTDPPGELPVPAASGTTRTLAGQDLRSEVRARALVALQKGKSIGETILGKVRGTRSGPVPVLVQPILTLTTPEDGNDVRVTLYADRIERVKENVGAVPNRAEVIPIASVDSVQTRKTGALTLVHVHAGGDRVRFRFTHDDAQRFKEAVTKLILDRSAAAQASRPEPVAASIVSVADEIRKLAELRDDGILTEEEFRAQKAKLLGS